MSASVAVAVGVAVTVMMASWAGRGSNFLKIGDNVDFSTDDVKTTSFVDRETMGPPSFTIVTVSSDDRAESDADLRRFIPERECSDNDVDVHESDVTTL